jgi:hypothetical protein
MPLPLADQRAEAWRELTLRRRLYPESIRRGTLSETMAARRLTLHKMNRANAPWPSNTRGGTMTQHCAWCAAPYTEDNPLRIHDALDRVLCERCYGRSDDATYAFFGTQLEHLRHWIAVIEGVHRQLEACSVLLNDRKH